MASPGQITAQGCTVKYKTTSGGTYAAIVSLSSFEPDTLKMGTIKMKRSLQDSQRWRTKKSGDPEAGMVKCTCVWDKTEYGAIRDLLEAGTNAYWQLIIQDATTGSTWERRGHVAEIDEPKAVQGEEGGEEVLWGFTIEVTGEPTYTAGT